MASSFFWVWPVFGPCGLWCETLLNCFRVHVRGRNVSGFLTRNHARRRTEIIWFPRASHQEKQCMRSSHSFLFGKPPTMFIHILFLSVILLLCLSQIYLFCRNQYIIYITSLRFLLQPDVTNILTFKMHFMHWTRDKHSGN